jgi:hypothetical protein
MDPHLRESVSTSTKSMLTYADPEHCMVPEYNNETFVVKLHGCDLRTYCFSALKWFNWFVSYL